MVRSLKQADRRRRADEKGNPHIELRHRQAVVFESRNEIICIGAGGAARESNLRSAREDLPLGKARDLVRKMLVHDNKKGGFDELKRAQGRRTGVLLV